MKFPEPHYVDTNGIRMAVYEQGPKDGVPVVMVSAADDIVPRPEMTIGMEQYVPDLEKHVIAECGHWTQSEKPEELNALMVDWLKRRFG